MNLEEALLHLKQEPHIARAIQSIEMVDFTPSGNVYFDLLESIVSQQLSVKAASTIFNRFLLLFPDQYPHPELLIEIEPERLRAAGLSNQKAAYLQNVARFAQQFDLENHRWDSMSDDEVIHFLTQIKGVGKWTVQMLLMFTLGRLDVLPTDDLGIQQGMAKLFGIQETGKELKLKMIELAEPWRPWRTVACRYLWRWKDTQNS
ncbi:MAG: DNA-3-methyladenine glycosylase 2 family protein [Saprospiraceae bacterium]|nr:DNA-3-methyladenine glycosylase 2 family protein [Saprospiraceae bacterium]